MIRAHGFNYKSNEESIKKHFLDFRTYCKLNLIKTEDEDELIRIDKLDYH